jgi:hypothetical protein
MRLLVAIPHYFDHARTNESNPQYASQVAAPETRIAALTACLTALHQNFSDRPVFINQAERRAHAAELPVPRQLDVVICTTGHSHLLDRLPVEPRYFTHRPTRAEPLLLGFTCHDVLRERLGRYDYYCYLEDDLVIHDPWVFHKLSWFNRSAGDDKLLQANRYEAGLNHLIPKVYVDGDLAERVTAPFQDVRDTEPVAADLLGVRVHFHRTLNPHSGCFFLNARQMEHWAAQRHFLDRDSRLIGPLETAATLGVLRTFKIYRPAPINADFLEVQHFGTDYLRQLVR